MVTLEELKEAVKQIKEEGLAKADSLRLDKETQIAIMEIEGVPYTLWVTLGMIIMERRKNEHTA